MRFLKGVLRGGGIANEVLWITGTLKDSATGALDPSDGGSSLTRVHPRLSVPMLSAATTESSAVYSGEFCNRDGAILDAHTGSGAW
jgi:hypothetical protein